MKISISVEDVKEWKTHKHLLKSKPNCRKVVIVRFENQTFEWSPTFEQIEDISEALSQAKEQNKWLFWTGE